MAITGKIEGSSVVSQVTTDNATFQDECETLYTSAPPAGDIGQMLWDDMNSAHEAYPHGVPVDYDWYQGAIKKDASYLTSSGDFLAFAVSGMVYEEEGGNPSQNARVALRNFKGMYLSKADGQWYDMRELYTMGMNDGEGYEEDFVNDITGGQPRNHWVQNVDGEDLMTCWAGDTWNYHFYIERTLWDDVSDVDEIAVTCEAKLTLADPLYESGAGDDLDIAKFIIAVSCDKWLDMDATWSIPDHNDDMGISRFKQIGRDWMQVGMITNMPYDDLIANPPPM